MPCQIHENPMNQRLRKKHDQIPIFVDDLTISGGLKHPPIPHTWKSRGVSQGDCVAKMAVLPLSQRFRGAVARGD